MTDQTQIKKEIIKTRAILTGMLLLLTITMATLILFSQPSTYPRTTEIIARERERQAIHTENQAIKNLIVETTVRTNSLRAKDSFLVNQIFNLEQRLQNLKRSSNEIIHQFDNHTSSFDWARYFAALPDLERQ